MKLPDGRTSTPTDNLEAFDDYLRSLAYRMRFVTRR